MSKKNVVLGIGILIVLSMLVSAFYPSNLGSSAGEKVAVIYIEGVITGGTQPNSFVSSNCNTDAVIKQIRSAKNDPGVRAVVLRINSPGGSAPASQEITEEIIKLKTSGKPVVTSMGDTAASGAYWIASATDKIYANPGTLTGSIGVYISYTNLEELYQKIGLRPEIFKSGPHKDILSSDRQVTPEERVIIQDMVEDIYNQFVDVVAKGRNLEYEKAKSLADGRIYTGKQAKDVGLVDELGNMYAAVDEAAKLAGIKGEPQIVEYKETSPLSVLLGATGEVELGNILRKELKQQLLLNELFLMMPEYKTGS
ncbi:signal peptide peptidase SppA [Selenomonadales bacterium OttesenSCG-928-I06]|nr:signal peptide peptidase SppA [Selenomonadales bacterium OttesenSCG-928-I06]